MPSDTNRRVAEACGFSVEEQYRDFLMITVDGKMLFNFDPEHDERHAVLAAEKFGLFMNRRNCHMTGLLLPGGGVGWAVWEGGEMISSGTFKEAVCGSILALDDKGHEAL